MTSPFTSHHVAVVDLGYGDAGKGTVVDWLCASQPVTAVIRFNGGAQAGHTVVTDDGRHHTFAQFGAGTLRGVPTFLSRFMVVDPLALLSEADHLSTLGVADPLDGLTVDRDALVATPYHRLANQARELARGSRRHGSCGMGVGETVAYALEHPDAVRFGDLLSPVALRRQLRRLQAWSAAVLDKLGATDLPSAPGVEDCAQVLEAIARLVRVAETSYLDTLLRSGPCVFEGAQGVLLDEWRGFHPYTTWSTTTFDNVRQLTSEDVVRLGVLRCYTTRHGAGPFVTEDAGLTARLRDPHNHTGPWQGAFRVGHFDAVAHRYALEVCGGVDGIALTHVDQAERTPELRLCDAYDVNGSLVTRLRPGPPRDLAHQSELTSLVSGARPVLRAEAPNDWVAAIGSALATPVLLTSYGPAAGAKRLVPSVVGLATDLALRRREPLATCEDAWRAAT